jgi:DNA-binding NarL/FixJ family response regulator
MDPIRVLVVDDLPQVRQGLVSVLQLAGRSTSPRIEVVGEAQNGYDAIRQVQALHPDVILMDLEMPVMDGYAATRQIKASHPGVRVIILSIHADADAAQRAREAGADDFIVKGTATWSLMNSILAGNLLDPKFGGST